MRICMLQRLKTMHHWVKVSLRLHFSFTCILSMPENAHAHLQCMPLTTLYG